MQKIRIHKDDQVMVLNGKNVGKIGKVKKVLRKKNAVIVEGVNEYKRRNKPNPYVEGATSGTITTKNMPIHISNVMVVCASCGKPTRVGCREIEKDGKHVKVRFCKKCNEVLTQDLK